MLKATGVIRHIDELGRIVVPKEIRKNLRLKEGVSMEIYTTDNGELVLKKYCPVDDISAFAETVCDSLRRTSGLTPAIVSCDAVVACAGKQCEEFTKVNEDLTVLLEKRQQTTVNEGFYKYFDFTNEPKQMLVCPLLVGGDLYGGLVVVSFDLMITQEQRKLTDFATILLQEQF